MGGNLMKVNLRKLMQLIVFFTHHDAVRPLGKTKLFKLLYFTDVTHLRTVGESITGATYLKYPHGPVPMQGNFVLKELQKYGLIKQQRVQITTKQFRWDLTALQTPDVSLFTEPEMRTINQVIQQYGQDTASALSWKSHQESAWLFAQERRPLQLRPGTQHMKKDRETVSALALLEQWY